MNYELVNTDAFIEAAEVLFGEEATDKLMELADRFDDIEKQAHSKGFEEGLKAAEQSSYNEGYLDGVNENQPRIFDNQIPEEYRGIDADEEFDEWEAIERVYDALEALYDAENDE